MRPDRNALLKRFAKDPLAFLAELRVPTPSGPTPYKRCAADFQRGDFEAMAPAMLALAAGKKPEPHNRFWVERTKGASKDTDIGAVLLWLLAFSPRPQVIPIGAKDEGQANELRKAIADLLKLNPWLERQLVVELLSRSIRNARTGSEAEILTADAKGGHGGRPTLTIINELTHTISEDFPLTLFDNADKISNGVVLVITNAGHTNTWQERWRDIARESPNWYFSVLDRPAPWISEQALAESKRRNPLNRFMRLWYGRWTSSSGNAIDEADIKAAVTAPGPLLAPEPGWIYVAGCDLGYARDAAAVAAVGVEVGRWEEEGEDVDRPKQSRSGTINVMEDLGLVPSSIPKSLDFDEKDSLRFHAGSGKVRLVRCLLWHPPGNGRKIEFEPIERAIVELHQVFSFASVALDQWQGTYLAERLGKQGVPAEVTYFTASNQQSMAMATTNAFSERRIDLYDHDELLPDLRALRVEERGNTIKLTSPRNSRGHGDAATALAIALHVAQRYAMAGGQPNVVQGPLICSG